MLDFIRIQGNYEEEYIAVKEPFKVDGKYITGLEIGVGETCGEEYYEEIYLSKEKTQQLQKFIGKILKKWEEK